MGFSIGKVFKTIEKEISKKYNIDSIYLPGKNYNIFNIIQNIKYVKKHIKNKNYDIIHITGTEHYLIPFIKSKKTKTIITIHDLGFYTEKEKSIKIFFKYIIWIKTLSYADFLTFISTKSYEEAKKLISLEYNKVEIISNPVDNTYKFKEKKFNYTCPTILHIGTKTNKNLNAVIRALEGIPCKLRIVGKLSKEQAEELSKSTLNYSNVYNLSDNEILNEYRQCDIVSFPSLYEGFGMPIIEAQAVGRVVVTSDISPMNQIANDSAILVNPHDINSIREGFIKAIKNNQIYIIKGLTNIQKYTVKTICLKYIDLYNRIKS